jgi:hypothetical protein
MMIEQGFSLRRTLNRGDSWWGVDGRSSGIDVVQAERLARAVQKNK